MSTADDLRAARLLIAEPERWCQGSYARDAQGYKVADSSPDAVKFCAVGACWRVVTLYGGRPSVDVVSPLVNALHRALQQVAPGTDLSSYNDCHTHADVLALYDAAIALAEQKKA